MGSAGEGRVTYRRHNQVFALSCLLLLNAAHPHDAVARTIVVPDDYASIQHAINVSAPGDSVLVRPGRYEERIDFCGKGITVKSEDPDRWSIVRNTILDGTDEGSTVTFDSAEGPDASLVGFTITGGTGTRVDEYSLWGGGVYCNSSSPILSRCYITENSALLNGQTSIGDGGGVFCKSSTATIVDCVIVDNTANHGGGVGCQDSSPKIRGTWIFGNSATAHWYHSGSGGGVWAFLSNPVIDGCIIESNGAYGGGDGGGVDSWDSVTTIRNSVVVRNRVGVSYDVYGDGGGVAANGTSRLLILNSTIASNETASSAGGGIYVGYGVSSQVDLANSIVWGNQGSDTQVERGVLRARYSNLGEHWPGIGNITEDPRFLDSGPLPYMLSPSSPCVDSGAPFLYDAVWDSAPWWPPVFPNGRRSDMGAYGGPGNQQWVKHLW